MIHLGKGFLSIVIASVGVGVSASLGLPYFVKVFLVSVFTVFDMVCILKMLSNVRNRLWELFYLYLPPFAFFLWRYQDWLYCGIGIKMCILSLECSFLAVLIGIFVWWFVFLYEKIKKLYLKFQSLKRERIGFFSSFF